MTSLIAMFSVFVLLGCLHMQPARNPKGAQPRMLDLPNN